MTLIKQIGKLLYRLVPNSIKKLINLLKGRVEASIRMQLILTIILCFFLALFTEMVFDPLLAKWESEPRIDYTMGMERIDNEAKELANMLSSEVPPTSMALDDMVKERIEHSLPMKTLIVDFEGKVLLKSENATETQVDLYAVINRAMELRRPDYQYSGYDYSYYYDNHGEFFSFYPVSYKNIKAFVITSGIPEARIIHMNPTRFLPVTFFLVSFVVFFYYLTRRKMKYIEELAMGLYEMSKGNLHFRVAARSRDELGSLANNINHMAEELQQKIEEERRIERTKNELITNVSHDLRTPLTSIMGYLRLIMEKRYESEEKMEGYAQIAFAKSEKLKTLIDDLFEFTKLTDHRVHLSRERVNLGEMLSQLLEEYVPQCEANQLTIEKELPQQPVIAYIDSDKMVRVIDNLLTNAIAYSEKPGVIKMAMKLDEASVLLSVENRGEPIVPEDLGRLFDRFYRVDKSRSEETGGSGLGLAIAKSIVELHGGTIWAESEGELIRFVIKLPAAV